VEDLPVGVEALRRQAFDLSQLTNRVGAVENAIRGRLIPPRGVQGQSVGFDSSGNPALVYPCGAFAASMYLANSGAPTHTSASAWQKVGSGGGTATWVSEFDVRPSGVSAQVDTTTNKRIDIRATGVYLVTASVAFASIAAGALIGVSYGKNNATAPYIAGPMGGTNECAIQITDVVTLTAGDYVQLLAYQTDSASEAYTVAAGRSCRIAVQYIAAA